MKTAILISANAEWGAVKSLLAPSHIDNGPLGESFEAYFDGWPATVLHGGWGRVSAAATTQFVIDSMQPDLVVNLGTCGGFEGRIDRGQIILVERTIIYDIVEQMTDPEEAIRHYSTSIPLEWLPSPTPSPVTRGLLLSGDRDIVASEIPGLVTKYDARAADWESGAIAWVAIRNRRRLLVLRGVSDLVGTSGGEAYGDYDLFLTRTRQIMTELLRVLPHWLAAAASATVVSESSGT